MYRETFTLFLAFAVALFGVDPQLTAQFETAPGSYPQSQQPYPQAQQYPAGQYPQPQQGYPQQYPNAGPGQDPTAQGNPQGQDGPSPEDLAANQQHGIARLSIVQGDVNIKRGDTGELIAAVTNAPVSGRDRVQTSPGSRAEIELDYGNVVRLAPNTDVGFGALEYHRYQVQVGAGTILYRVLRDSNATAEVDTPSIAIKPSTQGEYRISVLEDGTTQITVRSGNAEVFSPRGSQQVAPGQTMMVRGNPSDPEFQGGLEVARDQLDDWSAHRDQEMLRSQSYRYVNPDVYGADDLDGYGNWVPSQYGSVWAPRNPGANWSPYSTGHWVWADYYGWSWVDDAPWGWAPYHYGRWFWNGGAGWCWWPGAARGPAYWNPALVGFFGFGAGLAVGIGAGIGWVALAPFELFHPWWGHGFGYRGGFGYDRFGGFRGNIAGMYRNAGIRGGAMTAGYGQFGSHFGRFSQATREQLAGGSAYRGQMPIRPTQASYRFSDRQARVNPSLASVQNRSFYSHQQAGGSLGRGGQSGFVGNGQRGFGSAGINSNARPAGVSQNGAAAGRSGNERYSGGAGGTGWQRFGDSGRAGNMRQGFSAGAPRQEQSPWHSFGQAQHGSTPGGAGPSNQGNYGRSYGNGGYGSPSPQGRSFGGSPYGSAQPRSLSNGNGGNTRGSFGTAPAPHYSAPSYSGGGGGSQHYSQPHCSAPHASGGSAPRGGGGGGGGGGGHASGGGGHSSGGGRHR